MCGTLHVKFSFSAASWPARGCWCCLLAPEQKKKARPSPHMSGSGGRRRVEASSPPPTSKENQEIRKSRMDGRGSHVAENNLKFGRRAANRRSWKGPSRVNEGGPSASGRDIGRNGPRAELGWRTHPPAPPSSHRIGRRAGSRCEPRERSDWAGFGTPAEARGGAA